MSDLAQTLASFDSCGYVVAPAGFGKTYLITASVAAAKGRQLLLTHTYAGVNVLRRRLRERGIGPERAHTLTIASFALRLTGAYPGASRYSERRPQTPSQWNSLYAAAASLIDQPFVRRILLATYAGLFVDEYQDCTSGQHQFVMAIAKHLPCRILGDPLQRIFDFSGQVLVDWDADLLSRYEEIGQLDTPHRWIRAGNKSLGLWLTEVRRRILSNEAIDVSGLDQAGVTYHALGSPTEAESNQARVCRETKRRNGSIVAIHGGDGQDKNRCHRLARRLGGLFSSIEEVEGVELFDLVNRMELAGGSSVKLGMLITFAKRCMTGVTASLAAGTQRGESVKVTASTTTPTVARAANQFLEQPTSEHMMAFLSALRGAPGVQVFRADLFNRLLGVLRKHASAPHSPLSAAAEKYQSEFRHVGRPVGHRALVATTLLVKGLEFDHAIVLNASTLSKHQLYVALTRGAKTVAVIAPSAQIGPTI